MVIFVYSPLVFILKQFDIKNLESMRISDPKLQKSPFTCEGVNIRFLVDVSIDMSCFVILSCRIPLVFHTNNNIYDHITNRVHGSNHHHESAPKKSTSLYLKYFSKYFMAWES